MKKWLLCIAFTLVALPVVSDDFSRLGVFGGYQYTHLDTQKISPVAGANGWDIAATIKIKNGFGITGDFTGAYQTINLNGSASVFGISGSYPDRLYSYTFGPSLSFNGGGRLQPFVHGLFGAVRASASASVGGLTATASKNGFTEMIGGGLDIKAGKHISVRAIQADWVYYYFGPVGSVLPTSTSTANNAKIGFGIVARF